MNRKDFMSQTAEEMSIAELNEAMRIKLQQKGQAPGIEPAKPLTFAEEIRAFPFKFEKLTANGWKTVNRGNGVTNEKVNVINSRWNHFALDDKLFYVEYGDECFKEIIRRRK